MAKVYIKIDEKKTVIEINSEFFISDLTDWIAVDEGKGDKYVHAQNHYLSKGLKDDDGKFNYKYDNGLFELTKAEKEEQKLPQKVASTPTVEERLDAIDSAIEALAEIVGGAE